MTAGTDGSGVSGGDDDGLDVRTALFGSKRRIFGVGLLSLVVALVLVVSVLGVGLPSVSGVENRFDGANNTTTVIVSDLNVSNPNPIGSKFLDASAEYEVTMNGVAMANGTKERIDTPPGQSTVTMRTNLQNDRIPKWWVTHVRNDEQTTVRIDASLDSGLIDQSFPVTQTQNVQTDMLSSFNSTETREVNANRAFVSDPVLYVNETGAQWGNVTAEETPIVLDFYVYNPKPYPIPISEIGYDITMNDVSVGQGTNTKEHVLASGAVTQVRTVTTVDNDKLDDWWASHIQNNQVTQVRINFDAKVDVAGTSFSVPMDRFTYEETIETDIFGTKDQPRSGGANESETTTAAGDDGAGDDGASAGTDDSADAGTDDAGTATDGSNTATGPTTTTASGTGDDSGDEGTTTTDDGLLAIGVAGDSLNWRADTQ
ncbi:LEA type 2 family protein [Haloarchaeobius sp. DFWS5]|uniref:LEA type 2 family protein n=1 Tax=Haloarchaeobius sp. DFWS5 TaxID=3446114 RepID=UPI003EBECB75